MCSFLVTVKDGHIDAENVVINIGSLNPGTESHVFEYPSITWARAPSGFMMRGKYTACVKLSGPTSNMTYLDIKFTVNVIKLES